MTVADGSIKQTGVAGNAVQPCADALGRACVAGRRTRQPSPPVAWHIEPSTHHRQRLLVRERAYARVVFFALLATAAHALELHALFEMRAVHPWVFSAKYFTIQLSKIAVRAALATLAGTPLTALAFDVVPLAARAAAAAYLCGGARAFATCGPRAFVCTGPFDAPMPEEHPRAWAVALCVLPYACAWGLGAVFGPFIAGRIAAAFTERARPPPRDSRPRLLGRIVLNGNESACKTEQRPASLATRPHHLGFMIPKGSLHSVCTKRTVVFAAVLPLGASLALAHFFLVGTHLAMIAVIRATLPKRIAGVLVDSLVWLRYAAHEHGNGSSIDTSVLLALAAIHAILAARSFLRVCMFSS